MKPIPKPVYPCYECAGLNTWPATDLFWSNHDQDWVCDMCWDDRDIEEDKGICLADEIEKAQAEHDAELTLQTFRDAYKAGFDHGLTCDPHDVKKLNGTSGSIRMFDYQLEHYIKDAAERYLHQKAQDTPK